MVVSMKSEKAKEKERQRRPGKGDNINSEWEKKKKEVHLWIAEWILRKIECEWIKASPLHMCVCVHACTHMHPQNNKKPNKK